MLRGVDEMSLARAKLLLSQHREMVRRFRFGRSLIRLTLPFEGSAGLLNFFTMQSSFRLGLPPMNKLQAISLTASSLACLITIGLGVRALVTESEASSPITAWAAIVAGGLGIVCCGIAVVLLSAGRKS